MADVTGYNRAALLKDVTMLNITDSPGTFTSTETLESNQADDAIWILTSTFIIFTMQSGRSFITVMPPLACLGSQME